MKRISIKTLIDITQTNVKRNTKPSGSPLSDKDHDFRRNQQRNYETFIQLLGLSFLPENISTPQKKTSSIFGDEQTVWEFECSFSDGFDINKVMGDFHNIPIIRELEESVALPISCIFTHGKHMNTIIAMTPNDGQNS